MKTLNEFLIERELKATKSKPLSRVDLMELISNNEDINYVNTSEIISMNFLFSENLNITHLDLSNWDTSNVTSMAYMFENCIHLESVIFNDTSSVVDMDSMFIGCLRLKSIIINNISNVITMEGMFTNCREFKQNLNHWDTSNITDMSNAFKSSGLENNPPKWYK